MPLHRGKRLTRPGRKSIAGPTRGLPKQALSTTFILGDHGCGQETVGKLLAGQDLVPGANEHDLHDTLETAGDAPFGTVRCILTEGAPLHPGSGLHEKTHVQACVRILSCIKGVFRVLPAVLA